MRVWWYRRLQASLDNAKYAARQPFQQDITSMLFVLDLTPTPNEKTLPPVEQTSKEKENNTSKDL